MTPNLLEHISQENLDQIAKDLAMLVKFGYGEIRIRVQKGSVMGHDIIIQKKHPEGSNTKKTSDPAK